MRVSGLISSGDSYAVVPWSMKVLSRIMLLINILVVVQVVSGPGAVVNLGAKPSGVSSGWRDSRSGPSAVALAVSFLLLLFELEACKSAGTYHNVSFIMQLCYQSTTVVPSIYAGRPATINWSDLCYVLVLFVWQKSYSNIFVLEPRNSKLISVTWPTKILWLCGFACSKGTGVRWMKLSRRLVMELSGYLSVESIAHPGSRDADTVGAAAAAIYVACLTSTNRLLIHSGALCFFSFIPKT